MARRSTDSVQANVREAHVTGRRCSYGEPAAHKEVSQESRRWLIGRELFAETK